MSPLGRTGGTLSGVTCALLAPRLLAAAGDLAACQGALCALALICEIIYNNGVNRCFVGFNAEYFVGKFECADLLPYSIPPPLCFDAVADEHNAALRTGNCALDGDKVVFNIDLDDCEILNGYSLVAEVTGHLLSLENSGGIRAGAD